MARPARAWDREPGQPFVDLAREQYAQARAKGATIKAASQEAGVGYRDAQDYDKHPDMLTRVRELRQRTTSFVDVSVGFVLSELKKNVDLARDQGQLKSSNEALKLMYDIIRTDPTIVGNMARQLPPSMSTKSIKAQLLRSLSGGEEQTAIDVAPVEDEEEAEQEVDARAAEG